MAILESVRSKIQAITQRGEGHEGKPPQALNIPSNIKLPPFVPVELPRTAPPQPAHLAFHGWSPLPLGDTVTDGLHATAQKLFAAANSFFDDAPDELKEKYKTKLGSEQGWSRIRGEKEFITLRTRGDTPEELRNAVSEYWMSAGTLLHEMLGKIAVSLGMRPESLMAYSGPCAKMDDERRSTMLRIFRYEAEKEKVVAERKWHEASEDPRPFYLADILDLAHKDLGLLSLVIGDAPGLEVWDCAANRWLAVERNYTQPCATVLVGRELERLSNGLYRAGGHLVRTYPPASKIATSQSSSNNAALSEAGQAASSSLAERSGVEQRHRHSIVFVLRSHWPVPINTDELTTEVTGPFRNPMRGITAEQLFAQIRGQHFNINTGHQERDEQRRKLQAAHAGQQQLPPTESEGKLSQPGASAERSAVSNTSAAQ